METPASSGIKLCPYWAKYIRVNNKMMVLCSSHECEKMDLERPGWRMYSEGDYQETCQLNYSKKRTNTSEKVREFLKSHKLLNPVETDP